MVLVSEIADVITKGTTPTTLGRDYLNAGIRFLRVQNLQQGCLVFNNDDLFIDEETDILLKRSRILPGDVLLSIAGTIGKTALVPDNVPSLNCNQALAIIRLRKNVFPPYFKYWLGSGEAQSQMTGAKVTATISNLSLSQIGQMKIRLPSLDEQRRIAAILDKADALRAKRRRAITRLDNLLKSVFLDMFGDSGINPKGWQVCEIHQVAAKEENSIKAGPFGSSLKKEIYTQTGYKIYGQEQVIRDDFTYGDYYIGEVKYQELFSNRVQAGDILISLVGTFGKVSIVPDYFEPGIINPRLMKITLDKQKMLPLFFKHLLQSDSVTTQIESMSHGGTMGIVNVGIIKRVKVIVPPMSLQEKYLVFAAKIMEARQTNQTSLEKMENLFKSLQHIAFNGKLQ